MQSTRGLAMTLSCSFPHLYAFKSSHPHLALSRLFSILSCFEQVTLKTQFHLSQNGHINPYPFHSDGPWGWGHALNIAKGWVRWRRRVEGTIKDLLKASSRVASEQVSTSRPWVLARNCEWVSISAWGDEWVWVPASPWDSWRGKRKTPSASNCKTSSLLH